MHKNVTCIRTCIIIKDVYNNVTCVKASIIV